MPIDLTFRTSSWDTLVTVFNNAQSQTFSFHLPHNPTSVQFDPENWILRTATLVPPWRDDPVAVMPMDFVLEQNYPNPFNPTTEIRYAIGSAGMVTLKVLDLLGREVTTLVHETKAPGRYSVMWDARQTNGGQVAGMPSGIYYYRLQTSNGGETKKMVLMQ